MQGVFYLGLGMRLFESIKYSYQCLLREGGKCTLVLQVSARSLSGLQFIPV